MVTGHVKVIKEMNRKLIINTIRQSQPISRSDIAKRLKLSRSTVSTIVNSLIEKNIVRELGYESSTKEGGKRPIQLGFNPKLGYIIGIDLKRDFINGCLTDLNGEIITKNEIEINKSIGIDDIINFIQLIIKNANIDPIKLIAIGCSVPGLVDSEQGIVLQAAELGWKDVALERLIKEHYNCSIFLNNDVNCLAMLEKWNGNAINCPNFVYIYVGNGIGTAIVANNELITGANNTAGEMGFLAFPDDKSTAKYSFGEFGVYDKKASLLAFPEDIRGGISRLHYYQLSESEQKIFDEVLKNLKYGIANIVSILNPEKIIIGGSLMNLIYSKRYDLDIEIREITPNPLKLDFAEIDNTSFSLGSLTFALDKISDLI